MIFAYENDYLYRLVPGPSGHYIARIENKSSLSRYIHAKDDKDLAIPIVFNSKEYKYFFVQFMLKGRRVRLSVI